MYALAPEPEFIRENVTQADLLAAIKPITLAENTML